MLHSRMALEYRGPIVAANLPAVNEADRIDDDLTDRRIRLAAEQALDEVLADSFPASDPPSWNPGMARPDPGGRDVIDVSRSRRERTLFQALTSLAGAGGIALLVPFAILLVGLPVAVSVRGVLAAVGWLFGVVIP